MIKSPDPDRPAFEAASGRAVSSGAARCHLKPQPSGSGPLASARSVNNSTWSPKLWTCHLETILLRFQVHRIKVSNARFSPCHFPFYVEAEKEINHHQEMLYKPTRILPVLSPSLQQCFSNVWFVDHRAGNPLNQLI